MAQSPQHRPLVQSTRTKYFTRTLARIRHWNTRQNTPFTRKVTRITSLEHSHEVFHKIHNVNSTSKSNA
jgi:hypothetical protein